MNKADLVVEVANQTKLTKRASREVEKMRLRKPSIIFPFYFKDPSDRKIPMKQIKIRRGILYKIELISNIQHPMSFPELV